MMIFVPNSLNLKMKYYNFKTIVQMQNVMRWTMIIVSETFENYEYIFLNDKRDIKFVIKTF